MWKFSRTKDERITLTPGLFMVGTALVFSVFYPHIIQVWGLVSFIFVRVFPQPSCNKREQASHFLFVYIHTSIAKKEFAENPIKSRQETTQSITIMIQLYFKGDYSNSCTEVPDGTMITVQSQTYDAIYNTLKGMGCSHGAASFAASTNKWETAQERDKRMAKQSASSNSERKAKTTVEQEDTDELVAAYSNDDLDDDDDEPSAWSCMSFLEKVEYIFKLKWIDDFCDNLPKRILNAFLSFIYLEIMAVVWLLASLFSERWRNAVWKSMYKSVKWLNKLLDNSNIVS